LKRLILLIILVPALIISASANSGPTYMYANPGLELAVSPDCPIEVKHEDLRFDLSKDFRDWSPTAYFEAAYSMSNPTAEGQVVKMAFPYITSISRNESEGVAVYENGEEIDFEVYYGSRINNEDDLKTLSFDDILSNVMLESPAEPGDGMLYTLEIDTTAVPDGVERIYIKMSVQSGGRECITCGFSGGTYYNDGSADLSTWYYLDRSERPMSVYVPEGSLLDYSAASFESYDSKEPLDYVDIDVEVETVSIRDFLFDRYSEMDFMEGPSLSEKMYWELLYALREGEIGRRYNGFASLEELFYNVFLEQRLTIAVFDVEFEPGGTKDITVKSSIGGTMERPSGYSKRGIKYTYTYLSSPAKHWADFGTLKITVVPPADEGLVLAESSPELMLGEDGVYYAEAEGLPEENIYFVFAARDPGNFGIPIFYTIVMILALTIAALLAVALLVIRIRKKQKAPA
jgi:hypothetical protein